MTKAMRLKSTVLDITLFKCPHSFKECLRAMIVGRFSIMYQLMSYGIVQIHKTMSVFYIKANHPIGFVAYSQEVSEGSTNPQIAFWERGYAHFSKCFCLFLPFLYLPLLIFFSGEYQAGWLYLKQLAVVGNLLLYPLSFVCSQFHLLPRFLHRLYQRTSYFLLQVYTMHPTVKDGSLNTCARDSCL